MIKYFRFVFLLMFLIWMLTPVAVSAQQAGPTPTPTPSAGAGSTQATPALIQPSSSLVYPQSGEILRGVIPVTGSTDVVGLTSWELAFTYADDPTATWFWLTAGTEAINAATLFNWDTTLYADGTYSLRLRVFTSDGFKDVISDNLRIRNYSEDTPTPTLTPFLTSTPTITNTPPLPTATATPTYTLVPTPTDLPKNPAQVTTEQINLSLLQGAAIAVVIFALFGGLIWLRNHFTD